VTGLLSSTSTSLVKNKYKKCPCLIRPSPTKQVLSTPLELVARDEETHPIAKRAIIVTLLTAAATAAAGEAAVLAVDAVAGLIKDLSNWDDAREAFTKQTTATMWAKNPDTSKYQAAICYNKGYSLKNSAGRSEVVSARLKSGVLSTE
jgi:hypothetical protein